MLRNSVRYREISMSGHPLIVIVGSKDQPPFSPLHAIKLLTADALLRICSKNQSAIQLKDFAVEKVVSDYGGNALGYFFWPAEPTQRNSINCFA